jgi:multiple sugar transport system permease protein
MPIQRRSVNSSRSSSSVGRPPAIVLLRQTFAKIPAEFTEAALIDGCSPLRAFTSIVLPLANAGVATVAVLSFLWGWGDLVFALTLVNDDAKRPVTTGLWTFFGANTADWGGAMAFSTLAMLPPLLIFLLSQRLVGAGGLKG